MSTTRTERTAPDPRGAAGAGSAAPQAPALRFFGTTWVARGGAYWALRAGFVLVALLAAAAGALVMRFALQGLSTGSDDRLLSVLGTVGVGVCTALAAGRTWTRLEKGRKERPDRTVMRRSAQARAEEAEQQRAGRRNPQTPLMVLGFVGWLLAHAVHGCLEAPGESAARREYQRARDKAAAKARRKPSKGGGKAPSGDGKPRPTRKK